MVGLDLTNGSVMERKDLERAAASSYEVFKEKLLE
jgi:hypothetical protein